MKISPKRYINARLLSKETRFAESTEYTFQCLHWSETIDIKNSIKMALKKTNRQNINVGHLKDPNNVLTLMKDQQIMASFSKVRGTPPYWKQMSMDMMAKIRQFGPHTFFITGSIADFHIPEIIHAVALQYGEDLSDEQINSLTWEQKRNWLMRNPVTVARHIDYIFKQLWGKVILSGAHPAGQIFNYDIRDEHQERGPKHFHAAAHVLGAPRLDKDPDTKVIQFVDLHETCALPDKEKDPELYELVVSRQTHHHTRSCKKSKKHSCRHGFKKPPSSRTLIARRDDSEQAKVVTDWARNILTRVMDKLEETGTDVTLEQLLDEADILHEDYVKALQVSLKRTAIILKRRPCETSINNYNPVILRALRSNMDIQYITDIWACIAYITSYMCKPEKNLSELMSAAVKEAETQREKLKVIGDTLCKGREVSQHEAIYRVLSLPMRKSNIAVEFFQTGEEDKRTHMTKPYHVL